MGLPFGLLCQFRGMGLALWGVSKLRMGQSALGLAALVASHGGERAAHQLGLLGWDDDALRCLSAEGPGSFEPSPFNRAG